METGATRVRLEIEATFTVELPIGRSAETQLADFVLPALEELKGATMDVAEIVYKFTEFEYPPCPFDQACNALGHSPDDEGYCPCPRGTMRYMESTGASHAVSVQVAAIHVALETRQYGFDGHDAAFKEFNNKFIENGWSNEGAKYTTWVEANQPAVQWALDFANLRSYL